MNSSRSRTQRIEEVQRHAAAPDPLAAPSPADEAPCPFAPAAEACDLVTVPTRQGLEAVDILRRQAPSVGPVLHDDSHDTLGFVVPAGTAAAWDLPGSACTGTAGRGLPLAPAATSPTGAAGSASPSARAADSTTRPVDMPAGPMDAPAGSVDGSAGPSDPAAEVPGSAAGIPDPAAGLPGSAAPSASPATPSESAGWLLPPTDTDPVTDPAALRAALGEAARMIAAADAITHTSSPSGV